MRGDRMEFACKTPIRLGWSCDRKFCAETADGKSYLLRITPAEQSAGRKEQFLWQQRAAALGVPMCRPVEYGSCDEGVYTIYSWVHGQEAEAILPQLTEPEQYAYGLEAGRILRKWHTLPAPENQPDWEARFNAKIQRNIQRYRACPIQWEGAAHMMAYIEANRHLLKDRPQCFQHGDYHVGNLMIENGRIVVIDFDRCDFGDPWEEFNRIVWCAQCAPRFAAGRVDGYFDGPVPDDFWRLLALYISSNMLSSIPWAIPFGEDEIHTMLRQAEVVLDWYDNMHNPIPTWYGRA